MRKKSWTWCCLGMCTVASLMSLEARGEAQDSAQRTDEIYEYARPAVVHIFSGWAGSLTYRGQKLEDQYVLSGTGMIISQDGYILTNAHVVEPTHEGDAIGRRTLYAQMVAKLARQSGLPAASVNEELTKQRVEVQLQRINLVYFSDDRSLPFEIKSYGTPTGRGTDLTTGKDVAVLKIEIRNAPTLPLGASANPKVGQEVWILGFPGAATSTEIPSNHEVTTELGRITSIAKRTQDGVPIIQTSANVGHGNSGGPVLNARGEVIGLMTFLADVENGPESSKFSFVVPVDTANEFVRQAGVSLGRGPVDALWREALSHFWAQRYTRAKDNLEQILNLNPHHAAAKEHLQRAQEEISAGHDERGLDDWLIYLLAGLLVASAVVAAVVWRKRAGPRASRPALPMAGQAVSVAQVAPQPVAYVPPAAPASPAPPRPVAQAAPMRAPAPTPAPAGTARAPARAPAPPIRMPTKASRAARISWTSGPLSGQVSDVGHGVLIGCESKSARLVVADAEIATVHAWVGLRGAQLCFVDRGSFSGSYVNGRRVAADKPVPLENADIVTLGQRGHVRFVVQLEPAHAMH